MRVAHPRKHPPMRLELRVPAIQLLPGVRIDPLQTLTGRSLEEMLAVVLEGSPSTRDGRTIYRVTLEDGVGISLPLGHFGEIGFHHAAGELQVTAPALAAMFLQNLPYQVGAPEIITAMTGNLSRYTLAPPIGATFRLPIGSVSIEVRSG